MLPKFPYTMKKNKRQAVTMGGINFSNVTADGDLADSRGISARAYPYITTRKARQALSYEGVTAMTVFQGKLVTVKGNDLYWGGEHVGTVSGGEKQFAAVNTKLCIMPDKVYLDAQDGTVKSLGAEARCGGAVFTADSVALSNNTLVAASGRGGTFKSNTLTVEPKKTVWEGEIFYGYSDGIFWFESAVSTLAKISGVRSLYVPSRPIHPSEFGGYMDLNGARYGVTMEYNDTDGGLNVYMKSENDYFDVSEVGNTRYPSFLHDRVVGDGDVVDIACGDINIEQATVTYVSYERCSVKYDTVSGTSGVGTQTGTITRKDWEDLTTLLAVGDVVVVYDEVKAAYVKTTVSAITATTVTFTDTISDFTTDDPIVILSNLDDGSVPDLTLNFKVGDAVVIKDGVNDMSFLISKIEGNILYADSEIFTEGEVNDIVTVSRNIPTLDYICESNNRLWGCSNTDQTIYASALGDPTNFSVFQGLSTDSYAVGVGSEEDFTACCAYDGGVLFFKEMKLHRILGDYPSEYTLYSYDVEGVQKGCHKSLQIMNEVLYYKGIHGVFAFTGAPTLISSNFGEREFSSAVAGSDGDTYSISMRGAAGRDYLFAYETAAGIWVLEDERRAVDFARIGKNLYMLSEDGKISLCGAGESEVGCEWLVQFTPFYETIEGKKSYSRILFRLELPQDSYVIVDVRTDSGAWCEAGKIVGKRQGVVPVTVPINRCDKFEIRLCGKGKCTILSMMREFYVGGDR